MLSSSPKACLRTFFKTRLIKFYVNSELMTDQILYIFIRQCRSKSRLNVLCSLIFDLHCPQKVNEKHLASSGLKRNRKIRMNRCVGESFSAKIVIDCKTTHLATSFSFRIFWSRVTAFSPFPAMFLKAASFRDVKSSIVS